MANKGRRDPLQGGRTLRAAREESWELRQGRAPARPGDRAAAARNGGAQAGGGLGGLRLDTWHAELMARIDQLDWLRGLTDWLAGALGPVRERYQDRLAVELLNGGPWAGHAVHPALSDLPIGLWTSATLLDLTDRGSAQGRGLDAAGTLSAAGLVAAGATALTGLADWTVSNEPDRRIGLFHGLLNTAAVGLQAAGLGRPAGGPPRRGPGAGRGQSRGHGGGRLPRRPPGVQPGRDGQPGGVGDRAAAVEPGDRRGGAARWRPDRRGG